MKAKQTAVFLLPILFLFCSIIITRPVFAGLFTCCWCEDNSWQGFGGTVSCDEACKSNGGWKDEYSYERKSLTTCGGACSNTNSTCNFVGQQLCNDQWWMDDDMATCTQTSPPFICTPGTWKECKDECSCDNWTDLSPTNCSCTLTLITLVFFTATPHDSYVLIDWATDMEIDNVGFHLWRSETEDGDYIKITDNLITAQGIDYQYIFTDDTVAEGKTYYYKLEDMDIYGASTFHGPVLAGSPGNGLLPAIQFLLRN